MRCHLSLHKDSLEKPVRLRGPRLTADVLFAGAPSTPADDGRQR